MVFYVRFLTLTLWIKYLSALNIVLLVTIILLGNNIERLKSNNFFVLKLQQGDLDNL